MTSAELVWETLEQIFKGKVVKGMKERGDKWKREK